MVEDFILLELKFEHSLLFIMNGGRVRGACKLSSKVALQRVSGRKGNSDDSQETVIEPVSWPGQFVWSHLGLSVFPLDQLLGCVCKTFTFFRPPPPSVGDFAQPRGRLNIKFFYCFLIKLPWFSRMACTLLYPVEQIQLGGNHFHPSHFLLVVRSKQNKTHTHQNLISQNPLQLGGV